MTKKTPLLAVSALALMTSPALADITADQAWDDIVSWMESGSGEVTFANEARDGNVLTISGVSASAEGDGVASATLIDQITLTETADGAVLLALSSPIAIETVTEVDGESVTNTVDITLSGQDIRLSGDGVVSRYDFALALLDASIDGIAADNDGGEPLDMTIQATGTGISGSYDITTDTMRRIISDAVTERLEILVRGAAPDSSGENFNFTMSADNIVTKGTTDMPLEIASPDFADMVNAGLTFDASYTFQNGTYAMSGDGPDGTFQLQSSSEEGAFDMAIDAGGFSLESLSKNATMIMSGSQIPLPPLPFTIAENGFELQMPLQASAAPQSFALGFRMIDLVVPEPLYSMFDPAGLFPREPASIELEMTGSGILSTSLTDPEIEDLSGPPGELQSVDIPKLRVALAGAELTGDGAFTFTTDPNGTPVPAGVANLMLNGGNALLDTLVQMGLVPEEQAMGARMMVGLFAVPGEGEDSLKSTIEVREDGQILANGQRIR